MRISILAVLVLSGTSVLAAPAGERCQKKTCDYATGTGCGVVEETDTIFPMEVESLTAIEGRAKTCALWHGPTGCYQKRIRGDIADLPLVANEVQAVQARSEALPEVARRQCDGQRPTLSKSALDDVQAWCVTGQQECVGALQAARIMLGGMQGWSACIERMEARVAENARFANEPAVCVDEPPPPKVEAKPEPVKPEPTKPLKVVEAESRGVTWPADRARTAGTGDEEEEQPPDLARNEVDEPLGGNAVVSVRKPKKVDKNLRKGQVELTVAPFSGIIGIIDPATDADYNPMAASVTISLAGVVELKRKLGLELAITGRGAFASTALEQAASVALADLDTESGTAFTGDVEPTITLLSEYVGIGVVTDFRWDSIGITSISTGGLVQTDDSGVAGGARLLAGYGLLKKDFRFVGMLDYLFAGAGDPVWRATLRAELGPALITGQYIQFFRIASEGDAYLEDQLQLTLGFRTPF